MVSYVMDASLLMKQIKELRIDAKLFAGGAAGFAIPEFVDNAKDAAEYVVTATLWSPQVSYQGRQGIRREVQGASTATTPPTTAPPPTAALYVVEGCA